MKIGLSTLLFPNGNPKDGVELAQKLDVEVIEVILDMPHFPPDSEPEELAELRKCIDDVGLEARVHGRFWDLNPISQYPELRNVTLERVKESIRACNLLGGDVVTIHPGRCWVKKDVDYFQKCQSWFEEYFEEVSDYAKEKGVTLALETGSHHADYPSIFEDLLEWSEKKEEVGITLDVGHAFLAAQKDDRSNRNWISELVKDFGDELVNVHFHDNHGQLDEHLPPGRGDINFTPILTELENSYEGPIVLELWNPSDPQEAAEEGVKYLKDFLS